MQLKQMRVAENFETIERNDNFESIIFDTNNFDPGWIFNSIFAKNKCWKKLKSCVENEHEYLVYNFNNYPEYVIRTTTKTFNKDKKKIFQFLYLQRTPMLLR